MRIRRPYKLAVGVASVALLATACGGDDGEDEEPSGEGEEQEETSEDGEGEAAESMQGGTLRAYLSEPDSLLPTEASDSESIQVIRQIYRGLTRTNQEGEIELDLAESIETDDNVTWTISIEEGHTFTNGEPVDAHAFIRAWNYAGYLPNAQDNSYFMSRFEGFDAMQSDPPEAEEFSGLTAVDDYTIELTLNAPFAGLPAILDYSGFYPLAEECLADAEACAETPIGNGPYMLDGEWEHDVQVHLVRNEDYMGEPGNADRIEFRIFESVEAAYAAFQGGQLDIIDSTPPERRTEAQQQFPDGFYEVPSTTFTFLGFPHYDERFQDKRVRQAFSMAIDRQAIIDSVLDGGGTPATGFVSPLFDGAREDICEYCQYDPERAQELLEEAGGWDGGTLELIANAGAGHDAWMQALGDQLQDNLGIEYELDVSQQFAEYLDTLTNDEAPGPYRLAWGPDYPVLETYLKPLYGTGTDSNFGRYSNEEFDNLIQQGDQAPTLEEGIEFYQQAEDIIAEDMPALPLWFGITSAVYDVNTVEEFVYNNIHGIDYTKIVMAER